MLQFLQASYQKVKKALSKTRSLFSQRLSSLLKKPWNEESFEEFEQILFEADLGSILATDFVQVVRKLKRKNPDSSFEEILSSLQEHCLDILKSPAKVLPKMPESGTPLVILIVGVNGSGKTTSLAKLAAHYKQEGKKVLLAAADTFRAAAIEQLSMWATKVGVDIVKALPNSDPSAVVFDALTAAVARGVDVVLIDTAGRLQNKTDLMQELEKIKRISSKVIPSSPHETFLVIDATTGQNAIDQATIFNSFTPLTGIVLTKLDGSAKGGIILAIYKQLGIPVRWIGVGESMQDLMPFDPESYVQALFETED
jgi:fused signal recognition particle receptor